MIINIKGVDYETTPETVFDLIRKEAPQVLEDAEALRRISLALMEYAEEHPSH
jgi:hypothetical protein